jgi:hypothetical protein
MLSTIDSRLIAFIAITGVIASSQSAPVSSSPIASPPAQQQIPIENTLAGQVMKLSPDQIVLKKQDRAIVVLHLSPKTVVWSDLWVKSIPVQVGDRIYAKVSRRPDNSFDVQKMWVNIVSLVGKVSRIEKKAPALQISLENQLLGSMVVNIDPRTLVSRQGKETPYSLHPVELHEGDTVRIIGRQMHNGSAIATKLSLEPPMNNDAQPKIPPSLTSP